MFMCHVHDKDFIVFVEAVKSGRTSSSCDLFQIACLYRVCLQIAGSPKTQSATSDE